MLQIFVANPRKPPHIENILRRNKAKLCTFLQGFQNDKNGEFHVSLPYLDSLYSTRWLMLYLSHCQNADEQFIVRCLTDLSIAFKGVLSNMSFLPLFFHRTKSSFYYRKSKICKVRDLLPSTWGQSRTLRVLASGQSYSKCSKFFIILPSDPRTRLCLCPLRSATHFYESNSSILVLYRYRFHNYPSVQCSSAFSGFRPSFLLLSLSK